MVTIDNPFWIFPIIRKYLKTACWVTINYSAGCSYVCESSSSDNSWNFKFSPFFDFSGSWNRLLPVPFFYRENRGRQTIAQLNEGILPSVTMEKRREICGRIGDDKASGIDGIPNTVLKLAVKTRPDFLSTLSRRAYKKEYSLSRGKKAKVGAVSQT